MIKKIKGTPKRPRLYIYRSNKHIYAQIIDDLTSHIIATSSSIAIDLKNHIKQTKNCETAKLIGKSIANKCIKKGILKVLLDRGSRKYHGRIKALADSARENGLDF
jgi:large subunit ribosomal protein L18|uniref:Large ribosomal subunit protein uL18c n=1 Tax=Thorea hispida TaxID=202687 RepID=A0A1C9CAQ2_9FLOR|nr:ribosomal protein L18 [Thorea hispida]AOM65470.1 ribosomal protein L18 [Thorea hispida]ARX95839.1 50S ribosomal protein L18 [Thorea hispida]UNJ79124.1 ribosomal protein L18 [Thorea hispida]